MPVVLNAAALRYATKHVVWSQHAGRDVRRQRVLCELEAIGGRIVCRLEVLKLMDRSTLRCKLSVMFRTLERRGIEVI